MSERMLDRIIRGNFHFPAGLDRQFGADERTVLADQMSGSAAFEVANVAEYYYAGSDRELWEVDKHFPNLAPPFERMWLETVAPSRIVSDQRGENAWQSPVRAWGVDCRSIRFDPDTVPYSQTHLAQLNGGTLARGWDGQPNEPGDDERGWTVGMMPFVQIEGEGIIGPWFTYVLVVRDDGTLYGPPAIIGTWMPDHNDTNALSELIKPLLLAISFLHCKNVRVQEEESQLSRQERRRLERAGIEPVRFKTLDIAPMRQILEYEGGAAAVGIQRALHICRGHFATYTEDKPLFGRHAGTFWVPAHVKGSVKEGIVGKDYRVLAPKATGGNA